MTNFVEQLQKKSEKTKKRILFITVFVSIGVIISIWVISLENRFSSSSIKEDIKNDFQSLDGLKDNLSNSFNGISESIISGKEQLKLKNNP